MQVRNVKRRLGPEVIRQLVAEYEAGAPSTELMARYQIGKSTVLKLLQENGVTMRRQGLPSDRLDEAISLYQQGMSAEQIGHELGCDGDTVRKHFRQRGVPMRDPRFGVKRPRKPKLG